MNTGLHQTPSLKPLIVVKNLVKHYPYRGGTLGRVRGWKHAVDGVSFDIREGETLGLAGESGSGKTTIGLCVLGLIKPTSGTIQFDGIDMASLGRDESKTIRREMQIIFENPLASLNPRMKVVDIVSEGLFIHRPDGPGTHRERALEMLRKVGIDRDLTDRYPGAFSSGQQQRICIARALALFPRFVVADEPVSALDASIQASILNLLGKLQSELGLTLLFIAHDLRVIEHVADRVAVLYLGKIVEMARREDIFSHPHHPYTRALLSAVPALPRGRKKQRILLSGETPSALDPPQGCRFHTRCPIAIQRCSIEEPSLIPVNGDHRVACWLVDGDRST
jgi:oligopeptide/dipeptide ABC transporter ATP-binding protein